MITTLFAMAAANFSPALEVDAPRMLAAIRQVEGHKWSDPGGAYAITERVWRDRSKLPWRYASSPDHAEFVGTLHLRWLAAQLRADQRPVNAYSLAACWLLGYSGFCARRAVCDYAVRVENLYAQS